MSIANRFRMAPGDDVSLARAAIIRSDGERLTASCASPSWVG